MQEFTVSRDDSIYEAWPDIALTRDEKLVCVFAECTHHLNREWTRIVLTTSSDRGRTWSVKRALSEPLHCHEPNDRYWNCPRITALTDGRLVVVCDRVRRPTEGPYDGEVLLWQSKDGGETWSEPQSTPIEGMVPDQLVLLRDGSWMLGAHRLQHVGDRELWEQRYWRSLDEGGSWQGPIVAASSHALKVCEGSLLELPSGELVCFLRENSFRGDDAYKVHSRDGGATWSELVRFPLPGCHRPVAGTLQSGQVLITHRFMQGGQGWAGWWTQNLFAALTDVESCLAERREDAHTRILPLDFDRSPHSDTGYSGWVQFDDGEIYVVNYILDDAPIAQIRGYSICIGDFVLG